MWCTYFSGNWVKTCRAFWSRRSCQFHFQSPGKYCADWGFLQNQVWYSGTPRGSFVNHISPVLTKKTHPSRSQKFLPPTSSPQSFSIKPVGIRVTWEHWTELTALRCSSCVHAFKIILSCQTSQWNKLWLDTHAPLLYTSVWQESSFCSTFLTLSFSSWQRSSSYGCEASCTFLHVWPERFAASWALPKPSIYWWDMKYCGGGSELM